MAHDDRPPPDGRFVGTTLMDPVSTARASPPLVLVVDDVAANRELLEAQLEGLGYEVREARDGIEALETVEAQEPDLLLLDVSMPRLDGLTVCQRLKSHPTRRLIPVVILTAHQDRDTRLRGLAAGADEFLSKPFDAAELRVRIGVLLRERELNKQLDAAEGVILALARIVEARDRYTIHHAERVGQYSREIGRARGMGAEDLDVLYKGGVLHDLGKIVVPGDILLKAGPLNEAERAVIELHAPEGARLCESLRSVSRMVPIIRHHHERFDGRGYPDHLVGSDTPLLARIGSIADSWDAMTSDRPYRLALNVEESLERLRAGSGTQWDPELVDVFLALLDGGLMERVVAAPIGLSGTISTSEVLRGT